MQLLLCAYHGDSIGKPRKSSSKYPQFTNNSLTKVDASCTGKAKMNNKFHPSTVVPQTTSAAAGEPG